MKFSFRLRSLLTELGMAQRGIITSISKATGIDRRRLYDMYNDQARFISIDAMGPLCRWLEDQGVAPERLPGDLFGLSALWQTVVQARFVRLYLGERSTEEGEVSRRWVSSRDAAVASEITRKLSKRRAAPQISTRLLPVGDEAVGREVFANARRSQDCTVDILIGSQRILTLAETIVESCFEGCRAFEEVTAESRVPFYLLTKPDGFVPPTPSCFGGKRPPPGYEGELASGVLHLDARGTWRHSASIDAGVVLTTYDRSREALEIAIMGYTGHATRAIGCYLLEHDELFWDGQVAAGQRAVGVYACEVLGDESDETPPCRVTPLSADVLAPRLKCGARTE